MSHTYQLTDLTNQDYSIISTTLKKGGIAVMPSDTIYGIFTSALNPQSVEKIYKIRKRDKNKAVIILISKISDLKKFNINITEQTKKFLKSHWPAPLTIVLDCPNPKFNYLHRGQNSLAFRIPKNDFLQKILTNSGPLIAPSANYSGENPSNNITQAKSYFGEEIDIYVSAGEISGEPSTIIKFDKDQIKIIRQGNLKISSYFSLPF